MKGAFSRAGLLHFFPLAQENGVLLESVTSFAWSVVGIRRKRWWSTGKFRRSSDLGDSVGYSFSFVGEAGGKSIHLVRGWALLGLLVTCALAIGVNGNDLHGASTRTLNSIQLWDS